MTGYKLFLVYLGIALLMFILVLPAASILNALTYKHKLLYYGLVVVQGAFAVAALVHASRARRVLAIVLSSIALLLTVLYTPFLEYLHEWYVIVFGTYFIEFPALVLLAITYKELSTQKTRTMRTRTRYIPPPPPPP